MSDGGGIIGLMGAADEGEFLLSSSSCFRGSCGPIADSDIVTLLIVPWLVRCDGSCGPIAALLPDSFSVSGFNA
jgi:hypothetical protein